MLVNSFEFMLFSSFNQNTKRIYVLCIDKQTLFRFKNTLKKCLVQHFRKHNTIKTCNYCLFWILRAVLHVARFSKVTFLRNELFFQKQIKE